MIKEAFGSADTIEEAKEAALAELGVGDDADVSYEVIDIPKKKTLGLFGGCKAKVRAFIELPDPAPKKAKKASKPTENKPKKAEKTEKAAPKAKAEAPAIKDEPVYGETVDSNTLEENSPAKRAVDYLKSVLCHLGLNDVAFSVALGDDCAKLYLTGENLGALIGHRGETLDALQYLSSLAAGNAGKYYKITLDVGNYREKREATLISLAERISAQVLRSGRSRSLEPMNPYERRIIHTAVQKIDGVVSNSVGEGARRRVVIAVEGGSKPAPRRGGNYRANGRGGRTPYVPDASAAREPKKLEGDLPLYGKIK